MREREGAAYPMLHDKMLDVDVRVYRSRKCQCYLGELHISQIGLRVPPWSSVQQYRHIYSLYRPARVDIADAPLKRNI